MLTAVLLVAAAIAQGYLCQGSPADDDAKIPNGRRVPNPCDPGHVWHGVGHRDARGESTGTESALTLNPFGRDFAQQGHKWTKALCEMDSDGDGLTNGQELGDPTCVWREGDIPQQAGHITHPGICDPWDSIPCASRNSWLHCDDVNEFKCEAIHEQGVKSLELRFPRTKVPADDSAYRCFVFDVPSDQPYHVIALEPLIDNSKVMRHMVAFACDDTVEVDEELRKCFGGRPPKGCSDVIGLWSRGRTGDCFNTDAGVRIGKGATRKIALQLYWSNANHVDHWYDSSGMKLYYTPRLRPNDAATMAIGQSFFEIPSGVPRLVVTGSCTSGCTSRFFKGPVHVTAARNHMQSLGVGARIEVIRNGHVVYNLTNDNSSYSLDHPPVTEFKTPVKIMPGDELKTICTFFSLERKETTYSGYGPHEETCYGFLTYYPKQNFDGDCVQWKQTDTCVFQDPEFRSNFSRALNVSVPQTAAVFKTVFGHCNVYGHCRSECKQALAEIRSIQPIYGGEMWEYAKTQIWQNEDVNYAPLLRFLSAIDTCDRADDQSKNATSSCPHTHDPLPGTNVSSNVLQLVRLLGSRPLLQNIIFNINKN